eukprot:gene6922-7656_t
MDAFEIDHQLKEKMTFFLQFKDPSLQDAANQFNLRSQSLNSLISMNAFISLFTITYLISLALSISGANSHHQPAYTSSLIINVIIGIIFLIINVIIWRRYYSYQRLLKMRNSNSNSNNNNNDNSKGNKRHLPSHIRYDMVTFQFRIYLAMVLLISIRHILRVVNGACPSEHHGLGEIWNCNPTGQFNTIPTETAILLMILPIFYLVTVQGGQFEYALFLWGWGQITVDKYWNILLPSASSFFSGLELLPMACRDAKEPRKTLPQAMLCSFGLIAMNALLLIITVGCNAPGSFFIAYNDTNPLYYGFSRGLHVGRRVAKMLNIPVYTPVVILGERSPYAALGFSNYLVLMTIWYLWQVRSTQKFSLHEQEIMFQAYVINANLIAKQRRRLASSAKTFKISILSPRSNEAGRWGNFAAWSLLPSCLRRLKAPRMGKNDRQPSTKVPASPITTVGLGEEQGGNFLRNSVGDMYALDEREFLKATNESSKMSEKKLFSSLSSEEIESVVKIHPAHKPSETIHVNVKHRIVVDDYGRGPAPSPSSFSSANSRGGSSSAPKKLIQSALLQANLQQQGLDHELYRLHIDGVDGEYRSSTNNTPTSSRPRSKKLSLLGQAIQEQLTHYLPSTEFMSMKDPVFEEKVEEFIFKRSRSRIMGNSGTFDIKEETTSND